MLGPRSLLGAAAPLLLLLLLALALTAQAKGYDKNAKAIKKQQAAARKNGCILGFYAKGQKPWPSSRRNRPITMYTIFKNRGSTPYEGLYLRYYRNPSDVTLLPTIQSKPELNLEVYPDFALYDPNYFILGGPLVPIPVAPFVMPGPLTIQPGTTKIRWSFSLPNCAGPQMFNVTILPLPNQQVPLTCWGQQFGVRFCVSLPASLSCVSPDWAGLRLDSIRFGSIY